MSPSAWGTESTIGANSGRTWDLGSNNSINNNGANNRYIYYLWKSVSGVSAFGTHYEQVSSIHLNSGTTVGANGYCGFKPRFVMIKSITTAGRNWMMFDGFRDGTANYGNYMFSNTSATETSYSGADITVADNGFTTGDDSSVGGAGEHYISIAFA